MTLWWQSTARSQSENWKSNPCWWGEHIHIMEFLTHTWCGNITAGDSLKYKPRNTSCPFAQWTCDTWEDRNVLSQTSRKTETPKDVEVKKMQQAQLMKWPSLTNTSLSAIQTHTKERDAEHTTNLQDCAGYFGRKSPFSQNSHKSNGQPEPEMMRCSYRTCLPWPDVPRWI